jgi:2,3-bisphosphoglycerate-dependent phosphoglycerate mutase
MTILVLLRHGQSRWNLENRFTGWVDVDLTSEGEAQARRGGALMAEAGIAIDRAFTSVLTRAVRTANLALDAAGQSWVPLEKDWRLNERHYGALTGLDKAETAARHGEEQVRVWRRSYDVPPPPQAAGDAWDVSQDRRYRGLALPDTESLATTLDRVLPYWKARVEPELSSGRNVLVAAHGNSLRAVAKHIFGLTPEAVLSLEIPTSNPLVLDLDAGLRPRDARYLDLSRAQPLPTMGVH